jgi:hypothetical protein
MGARKFWLQAALAPAAIVAPSVPDQSSSLQLVFAIRSINFGEATPGGVQQAARAVGFDLDRTCTGQGQGDSCVKPPWAQASSADGPEGRDNAFAKLVAELAMSIPNFGSASVNQSVSDGGPTVLLRLTEYEGGQNDPYVRLDVLYTAALGAHGGHTRPEFDLRDAWPVTDTSLEGGDLMNPRYRSSHAYVVDGVLVARLPALVIRLHVPLTQSRSVVLDLRMQDAWLTAKLDIPLSGYEMSDGVLAGRIEVTDLLAQLSRFPDPLDASLQTPLCINPLSYPVLRKLICDHVDIAMITETKCRALSFGMQFQTAKARTGGVYTVETSPPPCPQTRDPAADDCERPLPLFDGGP